MDGFCYIHPYESEIIVDTSGNRHARALKAGGGGLLVYAGLDLHKLTKLRLWHLIKQS